MFFSNPENKKQEKKIEFLENEQKQNSIKNTIFENSKKESNTQ